ncbi:MAG TPA: glycosyltransferase family 4 protein [Verrucomicrobiae bacterium]|nr:glycosyltransferase family 4 protein [Verrucomicrobiae bacterium]
MRLLEIFNQYEQPGGEAAAVCQIFDLLSAQPGLQISRATANSNDWLGDTAPPRWRQALWCVSNPQFRSGLRRAHASCPAEAWIVHNVFPVASAGVYAEALRLGVPIIQFVHNWRPFSINGSNFFGGRIPRGRLRSHLWREVAAASWRGSRSQTLWLGLVLLWLRRGGWLRSVGAWVAVSEFARDRLIEAGLPRERVFALRHFWNARPAASRAGDDGHYLFLGRLIPEKGVDVLLDAWAEVRRALGPKTPTLYICGAGQAAERIARAASTDPAIRAPGVARGEEKERLLGGCRGVIVPSLWWEPLGFVVYEAYEHGKPVLAAASGGLVETVIDGETGWLHAPGDSGTLAKHVIALESKPEDRARMGLAGRRWLERSTDPAAWMAAFWEIVRQATVGSPARGTPA